MEIFQKSRQKQICLHESDLHALSDLMKNGFSFQDSLSIIRTTQNQHTVVQILTELEKGNTGEKVLSSYLNKQYNGYFMGFIQYMSLSDTLAAILQITSSEKKQKEELLKGILYPSLLFLGVTVGVLIFNMCVLPVMNAMMANFQYENMKITFIQYCLDYFCKGILCLLLISVITLGYCLHEKHLLRTYHWISKYYPNALLVKYASTQFSRFYLECLKRKIPTKAALSILTQMKQKPLVQDIAIQLDTHLQKGIQMNKAMADTATESGLIRIFQISLYASNCETMLEGYLHMVQERTSSEIRFFSRIVQGISYSAVGIVIVLVYQVLLMPIQIMQTL